jgi:hypothetical protein
MYNVSITQVQDAGHYYVLLAGARGWSLNHERKMHVSIIVLYTMIELAPYACSISLVRAHYRLLANERTKLKTPAGLITHVGTRICDPANLFPSLQLGWWR